MKKTKLNVLILVMILPIFLAGCNFEFIADIPLKMSQPTYENANEYLIGSQTYNEVSSINIYWIAGDINIVQDENATEVTLVEENELENSKKVHSFFNEGVLEIKFWESGLKSWVKSNDKKITVTTPVIDNINVEMFSGELNSDDIKVNDTLKITMTSGLVKTNNIIAKDFAIKMTSGNFESGDITVESGVDIKMTSGSVNAGKVECTSYSLNMTSGSTSVKEIIANDIDCKSTTGKIEVLNVTTNTAGFKITSGKIMVDIESANLITLDGTTGKYNLKIPTDSTVKIDKITGSVNSERQCTLNDNKYVYGEGTCVVNIKFTSGKLTLR